MNKRFIWNFELNINAPPHLDIPEAMGSDVGRWESRFFWPENSIIVLNGLNEHFLALSQYQIKHREDTYYLIPNTDYNIKTRREQLFYKPILTQKSGTVSYGKKINLEELPLNMHLPNIKEKDVQTLMTRIRKEGIKIHVEKEALIYKFDTTPPTKLEIARLCVADKNYYSASIESHSMVLVESLSKQIIPHGMASDYVQFLRNISK